MSGIVLGLIDSGVDLSRHRPRAGRAFALEGDAVRAGSVGPDCLGHGSAIADVLLASHPDVPLLDAQVFHDRLTCSARQVAAALDWLVENGATLVNMSFGLRADRPALREVCERALAAEVTLIASAPARGDAVYPAAYEGVIRASGDARCQNGEISFLGREGEPFAGRVHFGGRVRCADERIAGASVGCAHVTRAALGLMLETPGLNRAQLFAALVARANYHGPERRMA